MPDETGTDEAIRLGDVPPEEFRAQLHRLADWIANYRERIEERRISPALEPGEVAASLPPSPPERPESFDVMFDDFERLIVPALVHWGHPSFLGYFGSTTTAPGIIGEMLSAALNVSAMTWRTSPAATELETVVLRWIREMTSLTPEFEGIVYDTASVATLHALAAAREIAGLNIRREGLSGRAELPRLRIYTSEQGHSSIDKAAITLGIGESNVRRVKTDAAYRMDANALRAAILEDTEEGHLPVAVVATVGTTSTTSVDPVREIAALCREHKIWLHVDAAYGGALGLLPEERWAMDGVELADSIVVNPHKWLFVPLDFSALYTRRPDALRAVFSLTPAYLSGDAGDSSKQRNYMDYGIQLGRRFRALKAWLVFRTFGRAGLVARIREHMRLARLFAAWVQSDADFELLAPVTMGVVCFRARPRTHVQNLTPERLDNLNRALVEAVNATGRAYLTHTSLREGVAVRLAVGNVLTEERHLETAWRSVREEAARLSSAMPAP